MLLNPLANSFFYFTHNEQRTTNNEQRTTHNEQRTTNNEQRKTKNEQRLTINPTPKQNTTFRIFAANLV